MKTVTIDGIQYRLTTRSYDGRIVVAGKGILFQCCVLPPGATLDSPELRNVVAAAVADYWRRHREASAIARESFRAAHSSEKP